MSRYYYVFLTFLLFVFGEGDLRADSPADFTFASKWSSNIKTVAPITVSFGGSTSDQTGYRRFKNSATMSVSAETGYNITGITVTFTTTNGKSLPVTGKITSSPGELSFNEATCSWSGTANSVVLTKDATGDEYDIIGVSVSYSASAQTEWSYVIPIEDLRYAHQTYGPVRTGILGDLTITATGWQSYTNTSTSPYGYNLLLSSGKHSQLIITNTTNTANITKVVLVGANGSGTFSDVNTSTLGANTYTTTDQDQMVWLNESGASTATVEFYTSTVQPQISQIWVFTNSALSGTKQNVTLSFSPSSGTADANITDYQISGTVQATVGNTDNGAFRPDDFTSGSVSNSGSNASFNQYHISTGKVGVNTGSTAGIATITAAFSGNDFYNAATSRTYALTINATSTSSSKTKTISIDDMRISKTANASGLNASNTNLDRTLGGFSFTHTDGEGVKFNNGDFIILRNSDASNVGKITIAPVVSSGTVTIDSVTVNMISAYTTGMVTATGTNNNIDLNGLSSYTFKGVNSSTFELTAVSDNVYIQSYTIYYSGSGTLSETKVTPTIKWNKPSDSVSSTDTYTSPSITITPANFDISFANTNTSVATVKTTSWTVAPLISLAGEAGTAEITASAASSTYFTVATAATYTITYTDANAEKWDFRTLNVSNTINSDDWTSKGDYYNNALTTSTKFLESSIESTTTASTHESSQIYGLRFGRENNNGLAAGNIRLYSTYLGYNNSACVIAVPVSAGDKVLVTFEGSRYDFTNATLEGDESATSISSSEQTTATLVATANGYVTLKNSSSGVKLYRIQVTSDTRGTITFRDSGSNTYTKSVGSGTTTTTDNHFSHRVVFTPSDGAANALTYAADKDSLTITSSDPSVLDVSHAYVMENYFGQSSSFYYANIIPKKAGTATLTITFKGDDNYKPTSYSSVVYTVYGPGDFYVQAEDQEIQQGQFSVINPVITDSLGRALGIKEYETGKYTTYVLGEDEDQPDYEDFFDFTYTPSEGTGDNYDKITMDGIVANKVLTEDASGNAAAVGATRKIAVSATPKSAYSSAFSSASAVTTTPTITIIEKTKSVQLHLYWDSLCITKPITTITVNNETGVETWTINAADAVQSSDKQWVFKGTTFTNGFPNGRMLYAKPVNEGDSIWFSYGQNASAKTIPANPSLDKKNRVFEYRRGIPIYIDDGLSDNDSVTVNIVATTWNASTRKRNLNGSVARLQFPHIVSHARPAEPTYDPTSPDADAAKNKDGRKVMNTAQNVVAYGEGASKGVQGINNTVFGKFSTSSVYSTEQLVNERTVTVRKDNVPVVSTEVAKRRFTAVQIQTYASDSYDGYGEYISEQTYTEYWYLFDTNMRLYSDAERTNALTSYEIGTEGSTSSVPYYKVTWYNKRNYDDFGNYDLGVTQEVDNYAGKMEFSIVSRDGAEGATVDASTGVVTAGSGSNWEGWVRVKAKYLGGEEHGGQSGEPYYTSTTDSTSAYFYVYIYNSANERPYITPPTRNFVDTLTYTIASPTNWDVYYTTDGTTPTSSSTKLEHGGNTVSVKIGNTSNGATTSLAIGSTLTVKAIAINPNGNNQQSAVVTEAYKRVAPIPDPIFDPDGVPQPYNYNTNSLTVQIACAYAGAIIYYTISDTQSGATYSDPVIGASNTYQYSGLSKVIVTGNKTIKAIAYDPVQEIYSHVVTSVYQYSDVMDKPYYQVSFDGGSTWYGYSSEDATIWVQDGKKWYNGQERTITPSTQIRIVDPNTVQGTIYYTVGSSAPAEPSADASSMEYVEGNPFTVGRTSVSKAITVLEDAASPVSSAKFVIDASYGNVWEAVDETTTDSLNNRGLHIADGFVISTDKALRVANTGSKVNLNSIITSSGGSSSRMYAQEHVTATFGGYDLASWEQMEIADAATGTPIDSVAQYSIKTINNTGIGNGNARDELNSNYNHIYSYKTEADMQKTSGVTPAKTHEKTFKIPSIGGYVRFEPERDGDLTIWCLQQGALLYENDKYFIGNVLRIRPVYLVDEQGKSQKVKVVNNVPQMWSAARLSENWSKIQTTAAANGWMDSQKYQKGDGTWDMTDSETYAQYLRLSDGVLFATKPSDYDSNKSAYKRLLNKGPNKTETAAIYQLYKADLDKNHVSIGDPIKPFAIHTGSALSLNDGMYVDDSNDGTGYVLASGGYAKYTFEVKAGKSYYFFAQGSKIGIRGFQFVPTETGSRTMVTVDSASTTAPAVADTPVDVTLNRTFSAGTWTSLVLPFSVSTTQLEQVFGDAGIAPEVIHFDKVTQSGVHWRLVLMKHYHQMIVAGTPVLIKPAKSVYHPTFHGVHIETSVVESMTQGDYTMMGSLVKTADNAGVKTGDYFMSTSGTIKRWTGADHYMPGTYAWLHPTTAEAAGRVLSFTYEDVVDGTTGIVEVEQGTAAAENIADGTVYDLRGIKVSDNSLKGLPKGVYIVNSKKIIVK